MKRTLMVLMIAVRPALTHHSFAGTYRLDQQVKLEGIVAKLLYRNPHSMLELDVPDETGQMQHWAIERGAALPLSKRGITVDTLKVGDRFTVTISPECQPAPGSHQGVLKTLRRPSDGFEWGTKPGEVAKEWMFD